MSPVRQGLSSSVGRDACAAACRRRARSRFHSPTLRSDALGSTDLIRAILPLFKRGALALPSLLALRETAEIGELLAISCRSASGVAGAGPDVETWLGRTRPRGDVPWPEPGPVEPCLGQSRARGDVPLPESGPSGHALARPGPVGTCPGQTQPRGSMPRPEASPGTRPLPTRRPHLRHAAPNPVAQPRKKTLSVGYLRKSTR